MMGDIPTSFPGYSLLTLGKQMRKNHISDNCELRHRADAESPNSHESVFPLL